MSPDSKALLISILLEATEGRQRRTPVSSNGFELSRVCNAIVVVQRSDAFETDNAVELMATVTTDLVELETVPLSHSPSYSVQGQLSLSTHPCWSALPHRPSLHRVESERRY